MERDDFSREPTDRGQLFLVGKAMDCSERGSEGSGSSCQEEGAVGALPKAPAALTSEHGDPSSVAATTWDSLRAFSGLDEHQEQLFPRDGEG